MSPQSFCSVPWNTIYISPTGDIENCCISFNRLGKFPERDLDDVLKSKEYIEIKSTFLEDKFPSGCNNCNHANTSLRTTINQLLEASSDNEFYHDVDNFKLEYLDVRWTNTCNSACVYCGPTWSSKWADELGIAQPADTEKTRKLKEFFYPKLKDIKVAYLAGGEPLLSKDNEWLLETLYEQNPNCNIRINTNLTNLNTKVYQLLCKFKNKTWIVSGESMGERYEYVRYGSKWADFEQNLKTILADKDDDVVFNPVYSAITALDLPGYIEWLGTMGVSPSRVSYYFYNGGVGGFFDPRLLPEPVIKQCRADLIEISTRYSYIEPVQQWCKSVTDHLNSPIPDSCTHSRMVQELKTIDDRRGTDNKKIFPEIYDMKYNQYWNNDAFCPLPWGSIYVETDGRVDSCCIARNNLGNLHNTKLQDIISGPKNIQIKQEMLAGQRAQGCKVCYAPGDNIDEGRKYHRDNQLVEFDTWQPDKAFFDQPDNFKLQYADLRFRNTCNYGCVYCGPELSSTWASELKQFVKIDESAIADVTQYFVDNAADLRKIYMAGGEPLLIKENQVILEKLLEINPHCHLIVNTNLSMIRGNRIFELLTKFPNVDWLISAEDMDDRYNYIRYPGDWTVFAENLDVLKAVIPATHKVKFNMVFSALNAKTIWDYVDFLLDNGHARDYDHLNLAYINNGHQFIWCDARALPAAYIAEVKEIIAQRPPTGTRFDQELQFVLDCLDVPVVDNGYHNLFDRLAELDQRRSLDSLAVFSDIYTYRQT